jgi:O-antigen/teichoic acid export membrane protein
MSLKTRSVRSSAYNITASGFQTAIQFFRSILLARLLSPDDYGVYTFAFSFVVLTRALPRFGMGNAMLHRVSESEGEIAYRVHFTLSVLLNIFWMLLIGGIGYFYAGEYRWVLWVILLTQVIDNLAQTGKIKLARQVEFKRIAIINMTITVLATISALLLAWRGYGYWSLVSTDIVAAIILVGGLYIVLPVWRPHFGWSKEVAKYLFNFGKLSFTAGILKEALDRVDDLWTGRYLGSTSLGFYNRAYTFATYPRRILSAPLNTVAASTYAELKGKRKRLSQAFFRVNSLLIRAGFFFAGLLALIAPEFIRIFLGVKWLPMLTAFRLMLIYTLLDPIKITISGVFNAVGQPGKVAITRGVQLVVLIIGLFTLGPQWGIEGVAIAVNIMLIIGIILLLWQVREFVDFSIRRMFLVPTIALAVGMIAARAAIILPEILGSPWRTAIVKSLVFCLLYSMIVFILERDQIPMLYDMVKNILSIKSRKKTTTK